MHWGRWSVSLAKGVSFDKYTYFWDRLRGFYLRRACNVLYKEVGTKFQVYKEIEYISKSHFRKI